jgi:hypothetical protein
MEETSLDDFLDAGTESTESADATSGANTGGVDPATTTFAWSPQGGVCARCGAQTRKRWNSQEGLVCGACKEWSALDS